MLILLWDLNKYLIINNCNKYFETNYSLKHHNEFIHKEFSKITESENDDNLQINSNERKHRQKLKKHKKSKKGGKK